MIDSYWPCSGMFEDDTPRLVGGVQAADGRIVTDASGAACAGGVDAPLPQHGVRSTNFIGHSQYDQCSTNYSGFIAEIVVYARGLPAAERLAVEAYLDERYDL